MTTLAEELTKLSDTEIVALWNVNQMALRIPGDKAGVPEMIAAVKVELELRGIPYEDGKRIKRSEAWSIAQ